MSVLTINKLTASVGAEVVGVHPDALANDDGLASAILDALEDNGVLVFHDLNLHEDPRAQVAFCERLGEIDRSADGHHPVSGIYPITLDKNKNKAAEYLKATFDWHIDGCTPQDDAYPQMATMLSAKAVSASGGDTEFASTYKAFDNLSETEREQLAALRVVHSLEASQRLVTPDPTPEQLAAWRRRPAKEHPLIWTHKTGRKSLVLGASTDHVVGMDAKQSRQLLDDLLDRCTAPDRVYRHEWSVGDTVIWDNRGVIHRATPYDSGSPREMLRTTVLGDEPIR